MCQLDSLTCNGEIISVLLFKVGYIKDALGEGSSVESQVSPVVQSTVAQCKDLCLAEWIKPINLL